MSPLYFVVILVISLLYVWALNSVPIFIVGIRRFRRTKDKKQLSCRSKDGVSSLSVIVSSKMENLLPVVS